MGMLTNLATLPIRCRLAAGILLRRRSVHWGMDPWLDARVLLTRMGRPLDGRTTVFDVGANVGQTVEAVRRWLPRVDLHCYEPVPATFAELRRNVSNANLHACGLGARQGRIRMQVGTDSKVSRVIGDTTAGEGEIAEIEVRTVDEEFDRFGLERLGVLKIDVEGHEPAVLEGAAGALREGRIDLVLAEARFGATGDRNHTPIQTLESILEPLGYRAAGLYVQWIHGDRGINDADVLFMRTADVPSGWMLGPLFQPILQPCD